MRLLQNAFIDFPNSNPKTSEFEKVASGNPFKLASPILQVIVCYVTLIFSQIDSRQNAGK